MGSNGSRGANGVDVKALQGLLVQPATANYWRKGAFSRGDGSGR
jgi:hypothetical protein